MCVFNKREVQNCVCVQFKLTKLVLMNSLSTETSLCYGSYPWGHKELQSPATLKRLSLHAPAYSVCVLATQLRPLQGLKIPEECFVLGVLSPLSSTLIFLICN